MYAFQPDAFAIHTEVYDGPLELLLYLIRRDGIDIRDIPIAHVTAEYLRYLDMMTQLDLDVAGDFLLMASTLCQLKSRELIPRFTLPGLEPEEEEDPRETLARRLLEYQRYKEAAEALMRRPTILGREHFARTALPLGPDEEPIDPTVDAFGLLEVFYSVLDRVAEEAPVHEVEMERVSMSDRVRWVLDRLDALQGATLRRLFQEIPTRSQRILTFLAILEMARFQMVEITQAGHLDDVQLYARVRSTEADLSGLTDTYEARGA